MYRLQLPLTTIFVSLDLSTFDTLNKLPFNQCVIQQLLYQFVIEFHEAIVLTIDKRIIELCISQDVYDLHKSVYKIVKIMTQ